MEYPKNLRYTKDHEWVRVDGDIATVGITEYAQDALGDIVFVELPKAGDEVVANKGIAVVESVKSVSDVMAPLSGQVIEVNEGLEDTPETVNQNPYEAGWMFKIKIADPSEAESLLTAESYQELVGSK